MDKATLKIGGMTCMGCVGSVTRVLQALDGVSNVEVSLENAQAQISFDPSRVSQGDLCAAVEGAGFDASV